MTIKCRYCKDIGKITLLTSVVDCDCITKSQPVKLEDGPQDYPEDSDIVNAWYSQSRATKYGTVVYMHPTNGQEITITEIGRQSTPCSKSPDLKFVGPVLYRNGV